MGQPEPDLSAIGCIHWFDLSVCSIAVVSILPRKQGIFPMGFTRGNMLLARVEIGHLKNRE
jgi:hypothetical protein